MVIILYYQLVLKDEGVMLMDSFSQLLRMLLAHDHLGLQCISENLK